MLLAPAAVCFSVMDKKRTTKQLGQRIDSAIHDRLVSFCVKHPYQPSIAKILEVAITEFLDREQVKPAPRPRRE